MDISECNKNTTSKHVIERIFQHSRIKVPKYITLSNSKGRFIGSGETFLIQVQS